MEGFGNLYEACYRDKIYTKPKIVVHDSHTFTCHARNMFKVLDHIKIHFQQFIKDKYGINLKYDMIIFTNFRDKVEIKWDGDKLSLSGKQIAIDSVMNIFSKYFTYDIVEESKPTKKDKHILMSVFDLGQKIYNFYPDNNWCVPRTGKLTINNIKSKEN
jgi:hypothetical protein